MITPAQDRAAEAFIAQSAFSADDPIIMEAAQTIAYRVLDAALDEAEIITALFLTSDVSITRAADIARSIRQLVLGAPE